MDKISAFSLSVYIESVYREAHPPHMQIEPPIRTKGEEQCSQSISSQSVVASGRLAHLVVLP